MFALLQLRGKLKGKFLKGIQLRKFFPLFKHWKVFYQSLGTLYNGSNHFTISSPTKSMRSSFGIGGVVEQGGPAKKSPPLSHCTIDCVIHNEI